MQPDGWDWAFLMIGVGLLGLAVINLSQRQDVIAADVADAHELARKALHRAESINTKGNTDE